MNVSKEGLNFIANWEGFYATAYDDLQPKVKLTKNTKIKGTLTIGYGTTVYANGKRVKVGDTITKEVAIALLEKQVEEHCCIFKQKVTAPLNQNQYDALASFSYNCGVYAITNNETILNALNNKQWDKVLEQLKQYNKSKGQVLQGLINRRNKEVELFNKAVPVTSTLATALQKQRKRYTYLKQLLVGRKKDLSMWKKITNFFKKGITNEK